MSDEMTIVRAGAERIGDLEPLWNALHQHHMTVAPQPGGLSFRTVCDSWKRRRERYERWLQEDGAFLLIAERDAVPVGYALVRLIGSHQTFATKDRVGELETLTVLPHAQGNGIGTRLFAAAEEELSRNGVGELVIAVASGNEGAARFYKRRGYTKTVETFIGRIGSQTSYPGHAAKHFEQ